MLKTIKELIAFIKAVANDPRIPERDKTVLLALLALVISPVDLIPDWIPFFGQLDDFVIVAIVLDYLFNHLDQQILLSHYPWGMKSYVRIRKTAQLVAQITPSWVKNKIWSFKPSVYDR
ncbi:MAG TPA: YkvA family protein [Bdellovibrionales bacterium]|nr:YkvA family protein [Bdellovibrionales bacterium]